MRRSAFLLLALLAGCGGAEDPTYTFRDNPSAILASKADFDPMRMAGLWHEVARFPDGACAGGRVLYAPSPGDTLVVQETCGGTTRTGSVSPSGPGRQSVTLGQETHESWVLWADTGYRTVVQVAPDGTAGRVLDRELILPADRRKAVLEVLDFNGFNASDLVFSPAG
ncbi:Bacterial lipocalin [Jannaschia seosinensis]|uniref:Bacterial lipocalin n=1 Tax=Jannaschia seosinensis TaxID=313367 RepID=A0A0M7B3M2_9RHOB|nr:lipocalin family protein [Jannaschia seosinensis]CUH08189.1 Bacterial lipocalin [Jannaschia seosinensis]